MKALTYNVRRLSVRLIMPCVLVAIYWYETRGGKSVYYPPVKEIAMEFRALWLFRDFNTEIVPTLYRMYGGYAIGSILGVVAGVGLGMFRHARTAVNPLLQFARGLPAPVVALVFLAAFGVGDEAKILLTVFACFFPAVLSTIDGVRSRDPIMEDVSHSFHLTLWQRVRAVIVPEAAPQIAGGLRTGLQVAFVVQIASEFLAGSNGIGYITFESAEVLKMSDMWAGVVLLGLLGFASNVLFSAVERRALRWYFAPRRHSAADQTGLGVWT